MNIFLSSEFELIYEEMMFETIELSWDFQDEIILRK